MFVNVTIGKVLLFDFGLLFRWVCYGFCLIFPSFFFNFISGSFFAYSPVI